MTKMPLRMFNAMLSLSEEPRFHGNGFIQLVLNPTTRLHVWTPELPPIPNHNAYIHDHVWRMESEVLFGTLTHLTYDINMTHGTNKYDVYSVGKAGEPGMGHRKARAVTVWCNSIYRLSAGSKYIFGEDQFHESRNESDDIVITLMTKLNKTATDARPRVLCPVDETPTDAFKKIHQPGISQMWAILQRAVERLDKTQMVKIEAAMTADAGN